MAVWERLVECRVQYPPIKLCQKGVPFDLHMAQVPSARAPYSGQICQEDPHIIRHNSHDTAGVRTTRSAHLSSLPSMTASQSTQLLQQRKLWAL